MQGFPSLYINSCYFADSGSGKEHMYVMEYMDRGSLWSYLDKQKKASKPVDLNEKLHFLVDIAKVK